MRFAVLILLALAVLGAPVSVLRAQVGAEAPAAGFNLLYSVDGKWSLYGAPQEGRLSREDFRALVDRVRAARFSTPVAQVVVMVRGSDVEGTIGLVEKRLRKAAGLYVEPGGATAWEVWHRTGYRVNLEKVYLEHLENVLAAEERYRDLPVLFDGQVSAVTRDGEGRTQVEFTVSPRHPEVFLDCRPWADERAGLELKTLKSGDKLKVSGQLTGYRGGRLSAQGCLFSR